MKSLLLVLAILICIESNLQITDTGHTEHFVGGVVIGGITSYLVYKKTGNKLKSWLIGAGAATMAGLVKEAVDPLLEGYNQVKI